MLRAVDDIQALLEDQVSRTQSMKCSPHVAFIESRLTVRVATRWFVICIGSRRLGQHRSRSLQRAGRIGSGR